jgi:hypothetical protein
VQPDEINDNESTEE